jgi:hypothetical protein
MSNSSTASSCPTRLRERIRAAGPTNRTDLGKQAEPAAAKDQARLKTPEGRHVPLRRVRPPVRPGRRQFRDQVERRLRAS